MTMFHDPRLDDPAYRARTWAFLRECGEKGERLRAETDAAIIEAGPRIGDLVHITPLQLARVVSISGSPPIATIAWEAPTGRGGQTATRSERRPLRDLVGVFEQPAEQIALPLPEEPLQALPEAVQIPGAELA
jgi:hypothetical protein